LQLAETTDDMIMIAGGEFLMGSDRHYPEEAPAHRVRVDSFLMDRHLVTNRDFARFVSATGYVTFAERPPRPEDYPGALPDMLYAGSMVFTPPRQRVDTSDWSKWWRYVKGANWKQPYGAGSARKALPDHPVVHVTFGDAMAYAQWLGKDLPTEAEWEFAARGGLEGAEFAWGDELTPGGRHMANTWQGQFPSENLLEDGYPRTSPVGVFPANGYGLYDMIGNVWEWTLDWYVATHAAPAKSCCTPANPRGPRREDSLDPCAGAVAIPRNRIDIAVLAVELVLFAIGHRNALLQLLGIGHGDRRAVDPDLAGHECPADDADQLEEGRTGRDVDAGETRKARECTRAEHDLCHPVARVCLGVLSDAALGERGIADRQNRARSLLVAASCGDVDREPAGVDGPFAALEDHRVGRQGGALRGEAL